MKVRAVPMLAGVVLLAAYVRIGTAFGFQAVYGPGHLYDPTIRHVFSYIAGSEIRFWVAHLALALPGALLIGWALVPRVGPALGPLGARVDAATPRDWRWAALAMFVGLAALYAIGRQLVLCDRSITDDESAVTFGARIIASGHLSVPQLVPAGAFTDLFTFQRDGMVSAMDFPGTLVFAAAAIATGLGGILYAIASAATGVAVAYAAKRWFGARACVIAAAAWLASPMIASLSLTRHGHVPSRMFVAFAIALAARLDTGAGTPRRDAVLLGLCAGLGFLCRPFEMIFLLAPLGAWLVWRAPRRAIGIVAGLAAPIACFAWYNAQLTGIWYLQARFAEGVVGGNASLAYGVADRLGFNLGFNALVLAVFFLGLPALAAVAAGVERRRPISIVLAACVVAQLLLCLLHDNTGVHSVGPIHLSETAVPLVLLATAGVVRGFAWLTARGHAQAPAGVLVAAYLALGCGLFAITNFASLHRSAVAQRDVADALDDLDIHHAIVIAPPFAAFVMASGNPAGTWMLQYPHPDPQLTDDVIFAQSTAQPAALRARFPDRKLYRMDYAVEPPTLRLSPIE